MHLFGKIARWTLWIWTGLFVFLVVPFTSLYEWNVGQRPVVTARVSNPRLEWVQGKGRGHYDVYATLDYDRPTNNDVVVHCHLDHYGMGRAGSADVRDWTIEIAARLDSCFDPARLPLHTPTSLWDWIVLYLEGCVAALGVALWLAWPIRRTKVADDTGSKMPLANGRYGSPRGGLM
jgi:hypothetical protein